MSIATLKKKTQARYNNNSVGFSQFSLNGTHRNQGYIGQDTLGRSLPRTLAKGNTLRGYGGCCGTYPITPSVLSAVTSTEDNRVVKPSVLDNNGMIATKYRWIRRPAPFTVVKSTRTQNYIDYLATTTVNDINACNKDVVKDNIICNTCPTLPTNTRGSLYNNLGVTITKPDKDFTSLSYGEHLNNLNQKCLESYTYSVKNVNTKNPPKATQGTPLPGGNC
jgi:hypothetical protein